MTSLCAHHRSVSVGEGHTESPPRPPQHPPRPEGNNSFSVCASPSISRIFACKKLIYSNQPKNLFVCLSIGLFRNDTFYYTYMTTAFTLEECTAAPNLLASSSALRHAACQKKAGDCESQIDIPINLILSQATYHSYASCTLCAALAQLNANQDMHGKFYNLMNCSSIGSISS